ncbi:beta dna polymerase [Pseudohyphozyma bogoriensis]|nr:beta dna polymerase [Pseudohyphozyma bogoriensis]
MSHDPESSVASTSTALDTLPTIAKLSCHRESPRPCVNQALVDEFKVMRRNRFLEYGTQDKEGISHAKAASALIGTPYLITNEHNARNVPYIGDKIINHVLDFLRLGYIPEARRVRETKRYNALNVFCEVYGIGFAKASEVYDENECYTLDHIREQYADKLKVGLKYYDDFQVPMQREEVESVANFICLQLDRVEPGAHTVLCGGYRRGKTQSNDVDLLITFPHQDGKERGVLRRLVRRLQAKGFIPPDGLLTLVETATNRTGDSNKSATLLDSLDRAFIVFNHPPNSTTRKRAIARRVDLIVSRWESFGSAVVGWTGSTQFERDLRRQAHRLNLIFDSGGIRHRVTNQVVPAVTEQDVFRLFRKMNKRASSTSTDPSALLDPPAALASLATSIKGGISSCSGSHQLDTRSEGYSANGSGKDGTHYCGDSESPSYIYWGSNMDVDCDGGSTSDNACSNDPSHQSDTAFQDSSGNNIDAVNVPYVVIDQDDYFDPSKFGVQDLAVVAVVCNGKLTWGVWADTNGDGSMGEASLKLAQTCFGSAMTGDSGHDEADVLCVVFVGSKSDTVPLGDGSDFDAMNTIGQKLLKQTFGGAASAASSTETTSTPSSTATSITSASSTFNKDYIYLAAILAFTLLLMAGIYVWQKHGHNARKHRYRPVEDEEGGSDGSGSEDSGEEDRSDKPNRRGKKHATGSDSGNDSDDWRHTGPFVLVQAANLHLYPDSTTLPYAVHLPPSATKETELPAIVFLHGSGSAGPKSALSSNVLWDGVGQLMAKYDGGETSGAAKIVAESYIVVLPLTDASGSDRQWYGDQINGVLKEVQSNYNVDPNRIHISGYSMGGKGTWTTAMDSPGTYAALITSAGFSEISADVPALTSALLKPIVDKKIAIRGFAGTADEKQPVSIASASTSYPNPEPLSGNYSGVHDPSLVRVQTPSASDGYQYLLYGTGGFGTNDVDGKWGDMTGQAIPTWGSADMVTWSYIGTAFDPAPSDTYVHDSGKSDIPLWAPDVTYVDGQYWMYYAASTSGSQKSGIFLAKSVTGFPGNWSDEGLVVNTTTESNWNAIDPTKELNGAEEGSWIYYLEPYYYLFASFDDIRVSRSNLITGPYYDQTNTSTLDNGGTVILEGHDGIIAPGEECLTEDALGNVIMGYHYLTEASPSNPTFGWNYLDFGSGWPVVVANATVKAVDASSSTISSTVKSTTTRTSSVDSSSIVLVPLAGALCLGALTFLVSALALVVSAPVLAGNVVVDPNKPLPKKTEKGQYGTNRCGTVDSPKAKCQTLWVNSLTDFCLWAPPKKMPIGEAEAVVVAYCTATGHGARLIPKGALTGVHMIDAPHYIQITGTGDFTKMNVPRGDDGGELDPHGANGLGNPVGGIVLATIKGKKTQIQQEWTQFISDDLFCIRICKPGPDAWRWCNHIYRWHDPALYNPHHAPTTTESDLYDSPTISRPDRLSTRPSERVAVPLVARALLVVDPASPALEPKDARPTSLGEGFAAAEKAYTAMLVSRGVSIQQIHKLPVPVEIIAVPPPACLHFSNENPTILDHVVAAAPGGLPLPSPEHEGRRVRNIAVVGRQSRGNTLAPNDPTTRAILDALFEDYTEYGFMAGAHEFPGDLLRIFVFHHIGPAAEPFERWGWSQPPGIVPPMNDGCVCSWLRHHFDLIVSLTPTGLGADVEWFFEDNGHEFKPPPSPPPFSPPTHGAFAFSDSSEAGPELNLDSKVGYVFQYKSSIDISDEVHYLSASIRDWRETILPVNIDGDVSEEELERRALMVEVGEQMKDRKSLGRSFGEAMKASGQGTTTRGSGRRSKLSSLSRVSAFRQLNKKRKRDEFEKEDKDDSKRRNTSSLTALERPFKCNWPGCPKRYSLYQDLKRHRKIKHSMNPPVSSPDAHACTVKGCDRSFPVAEKLRRHVAEAHDRIRYYCTEPGCLVDFSSAYTRKLHVDRIHKGIVQAKTIQCDECTDAFATKALLASHKILAHNAPRIPCGVLGCTHSFASRVALSRHRRVEHQIV